MLQEEVTGGLGLWHFPFVAALLLAFALTVGCDDTDSFFRRFVAVDFSYVRSGERVALAVEVRNTGPSFVYPGARRLAFFINGQEKKPPFQIYEAWEAKPIIPGSPKGRYEYLAVPDLAKYLGVGKWTLEWGLGPVRSNSIILEVHDDGRLSEVQVQASAGVEKLARSALAGPVTNRPPVSDGR